VTQAESLGDLIPPSCMLGPLSISHRSLPALWYAPYMHINEKGSKVSGEYSKSITLHDKRLLGLAIYHVSTHECLLCICYHHLTTIQCCYLNFSFASATWSTGMYQVDINIFGAVSSQLLNPSDNYN
jgi:hypothetical protein